MTAMKTGAQDYLLNNNLKRLLPLVRHSLQQSKVRRVTKHNEEAIFYLAYHDALTDLPNRIVFNDRLRQGIPVRPS